MRIFIGYHYAPEDEWVEKCLFPLVQAFGDDVDTGKHVAGHLGTAITDKIANCDGMIGVASRRNLLANNLFDTHVWVQQELDKAQDQKKLWIQLRETNIDSQYGTLTGSRHIEYDRANLHTCLVEVAQVLGLWHSLQDANLHLRPDQFASAIAPYLFDAGLVVRFKLFDRNYAEKRDGTTTIVSSAGALRVMLRQVPRDHFIQLDVIHGSTRWKSDYIRVDTPVALMNRVSNSTSPGGDVVSKKKRKTAGSAKGNQGSKKKSRQKNT